MQGELNLSPQYVDVFVQLYHFVHAHEGKDVESLYQREGSQHK